MKSNPGIFREITDGPQKKQCSKTDKFNNEKITMAVLNCIKNKNLNFSLSNPS